MLLLDIGNSAIKGQKWDDGQLNLAFTCRFQAGWQARMAACLGPTRADRCYYSSVHNAQVESEIFSLLDGIVPSSNLLRLVPEKTGRGVISAYLEPASLGADRWLGLIGAAALVQQDVIIVDLGSAITIDLLRADGQHLGGAILPGFNSSIEQFKRIMRTADFDHPDISLTDDPGHFTEACINIDYETTDTSVVEGLVDRWSERLAPDAVLIVTGGGASDAHKRLTRDHRLVPDLVFQGMRRQMESN